MRRIGGALAALTVVAAVAAVATVPDSRVSGPEGSSRVPGRVDETASENPLASFEPFIGGEWRMEDSVQVFEWAVGRTAVKARSYFVDDDGRKLVSEGIWFWHPGEERIVGYVSAIDMPVSFFEYSSRFEGDVLVSDLTAFTADGRAQRYVETLEPLGEDRYEWSLYPGTDDGDGRDGQRVMGGTYVREAAR